MRLAPFWISALFCSSLLLSPLVVVEIPPLTDLSQQTAQIRLLLDSLEGEDRYRVQGLDPNKLGYLPLLLGWLIATPVAAAKIGVGLIGLAWISAIHYLAFRSGRSAAAAAAASLFLLNHVFYWGILNFLLGLPVFCCLVALARSGRLTSVGRVFVLAVLLYSAHVLWLAAASLALAAWVMTSQAARENRWKIFAGFLPSWLFVAAWYPRFSSSGFNSETTWGHAPWQRLHPQWLLNSSLGGLQGNIEGVVVLCLLFWLGLGLGQAWWAKRSGLASETWAKVDRLLLALGVFFLLLALGLPGVVQHTVFFASRWVPIASVFLVLALPPPRLRPILQMTLPLLLCAVLAAATSAAWLGFQNEELEGLEEAIAVIAPGERVLGLDLVRTSPRIRGFPYYHLYAWVQVLHGNELARSFANEASSLVVYRDLPRTVPWTADLDWRARKLRRSDIDYFRWVLVHGESDLQTVFEQDHRLERLVDRRRWTLYRRLGP